MIKRTIQKQIETSIKTKPVTLITGARQVGKSTLCYEMKKEFGFNYVSLDDRFERAQAINDPELFLKLHPCPLIIDEVQYAPQLFDSLEFVVNKKKLETGSNNGMFILTGSQAYELMNGVTESMAGRVSIIKMSALSASEIFGQEELKFEINPTKNNKRISNYKINLDELYKLIVRGMYPELYDKPEISSDSFYANYVATYIERDVSQLINVKDKMKFQNFLEILASLTGQELVYDTIAKAIGVKVDTIQSWISVLAAGEIIYLLQPYNELSIVKRIVKRPKLYFYDTGLACYLARLNNEEVLKKSIFAGRFVETYIVNEIKKSYRNNGIRDNFYYYRDNNQNEIDLIILDNGELHFVECKSGVSYSKKDVKAFKQLENSEYIKGSSCILCNTETVYSIDEDVYVLPISAI
ncbi:MAG: ATP-binding protein [Bacilli bacterium]|nr:ATP-binding protein [Bacilli bacterium]